MQVLDHEQEGGSAHLLEVEPLDPAPVDPELDRARPLLALLDVIGTRNPTLGMHGESVGDLAALAATELGLPPARVERLRLAGILHDIGKVAVADEILFKPDRLSDREWREIQRHPMIGYILVSSVGLGDIADWVLAHHERPDGLGYPHGLTAAQIPLEASILSVTDAYHAMVAERPYQSPLTHIEARHELERCAGAQFDEIVVRAAIRAIERERDRSALVAGR